MANRRSFLQSLSSLPVIGGVFASRGAAYAASGSGRDYFKELGVKPFINAAGTYTTLTASLMQREVVQAYDYASKQFVRLNEVQDAVGAKIASLLGSEAAIVTSGASGALTCGTAACITGKNQKAILQLPDLTGLKSEVIIQKSHRYGYDHAVRACGVRMVEVVTAEEFAKAVSDKTAMALFFNDANPRGEIKDEQFVALGKKHNVPTFNDCSADVPPVGNLTKWIKMGFDLVTFSGGKGLCGPQSAGILAGRKDLIEAARLNTSPYSDSIARGQKVNKEEMLGMLVALEQYMKRDHAAEWKEWEKRVRTIADSVAGLPSLTHETIVPPIANNVPHLHIRWDASKIKITPPEVMKQMREGDPSIELNPGTNKSELVVGVWMLQPNEAQIVAKRLRAILKAAS
jgi:D-glucosaminate-6-phosphate ammonia-lyase